MLPLARVHATTPPLAVRRPWIVAGGKPWSPTGPTGDEYSFWLPRGGQRIHLHAAAPAGLPYSRGTHRGWLALADHRRAPTRLVLWEPLSGAEIPLPCLRAVAQVFLSGDPLASPEDWTAVAIQEVLPQCQRLHFWRPGHATWTTQLGINAIINRIGSVAFHRGELYFTTSVGTVHICDLEGFPPKLVRNIRICPVTDVEEWRVVSCKEEVLLVAVRSAAPGRPFVAEIYSPDWAAERPDLLRERVTDLGECSLFLGRREGFALSAEEFPAITRNCVYYVEVEHTRRTSIGL